MRRTIFIHCDKPKDASAIPLEIPITRAHTAGNGCGRLKLKKGMTALDVTCIVPLSPVPSRRGIMQHPPIAETIKLVKLEIKIIPRSIPINNRLFPRNEENAIAVPLKISNGRKNISNPFRIILMVSVPRTNQSGRYE